MSCNCCHERCACVLTVAATAAATAVATATAAPLPFLPPFPPMSPPSSPPSPSPPSPSPPSVTATSYRPCRHPCHLNPTPLELFLARQCPLLFPACVAGRTSNCLPISSAAFLFLYAGWYVSPRPPPSRSPAIRTHERHCSPKASQEPGAVPTSRVTPRGCLGRLARHLTLSRFLVSFAPFHNLCVHMTSTPWRFVKPPLDRPMLLAPSPPPAPTLSSSLLVSLSPPAPPLPLPRRLVCASAAVAVVHTRAGVRAGTQ